MEDIPEQKTLQTQAQQYTKKITTRYQAILDASTPYVTYRWIFLGFLLFIFMIRILITQRWYIVCYTLAIYLLNLFIGFLQPKFDPSIQAEQAEQDAEEGTTGLPTAQTEEFKPFIRRLPEFKFWYWASRGTFFSLVATLFNATDIPVFWPILVIYFFFLFFLTMRRQVSHMIKYRYVPWDFGKTKYSRK